MAWWPRVKIPHLRLREIQAGPKREEKYYQKISHGLMNYKEQPSPASRYCCCCNIILVWLSILGLQTKRTPSTSAPLAPINESIHGDGETPIMANPVATAKGATNGHSNGDNPQNHVDEPNVVSPASSPKSIVVTKNRNDTNADGLIEVTESKNTINQSASHFELSRTHSRSTNFIESGSAKYTSDRKVTLLRETVITTRTRFIRGIQNVDDHYIDSMTIDRFLEYIENERITSMPHRGGRWDKVLQWAEFFGVQIAGYQKVVSSFLQESKGGAQLVWVACISLLQLGPENAQALETTFGVFYKLGLSLSFFLRHAKLLSTSLHIRIEVGHAFNEVLLLVTDVATQYRGATSGSFNMEVQIDFDTKFGRRMEAFYRRKNHITDAMWESQLDDDQSIDIRTIRKWLSTRDNTVQSILNDRLSTRGQRDEYTCDWFQRHLLDFSRGSNDVFTITGPSGCGKTVLAGWIVERLQRPLGRKTHATLSYMIEGDIPSESTSLAIVKNLLLQLLETDVGDGRLFHALAQAYDISLESQDSKTIEEALWQALDIGLGSVEKSNSLMVILDGLDEVRGGALTFNILSQRLGDLAKKHVGVQAIILSGSVPQLSNIKSEELAITADHTHKDIVHVARHCLKGYAHFEEAMVEQLTHAAKGNFLWLIFAAQILRKETSREKFLKTFESMKKFTLSDITSELVKSVDLTKSDTKHFLSWLLVAERPLRVLEIQALLELDMQKIKTEARNSDVQDCIFLSCGTLVKIRNGIVSFRHEIIRSYLLQVQAKGKELLVAQAAQADLTMRMLAYCKLVLTKTYEPAFAAIDMVDVSELFRQHSFLEYAVRNWLWHFQNSSMHKAGTLELSPEFKALFPASVHLALIEWACWEAQTSTYEAIIMHELAFKIRRGVFTEKHNSVLQTIIICGSFQRKVSHTVEAARWFYRASRISQSLLSKYSTITISCTTTFLTITETVTSTTRTEIVTWKEEMLKYVIEACKNKHGKTSDIVIRYYSILAELYRDIHEDSHAEEIWRELREIVTIRYGKGSQEEQQITGQITIVAKQPRKEIDTIEEELFRIPVETKIWDGRRIEITLKLAESYEANKEFFKAEELYVMLWRRMTEHCHQENRHVGVDIHISMIDITLKYVYFLRRLHRGEEACGLLICLWTEYEEYEFESETFMLRLKAVGELMKTVRLLSIAVSVFKKCSSWFRGHSKHEQFVSTEVLVSQTVQEITSQTTASQLTTTKSTEIISSTTTTRSTESVIKEVFESTVSKTTVTKESISVFKSLVSFYMKQQQWTEAIATSERSLALVWKVVVSGGGPIALPREFSSEAFQMAIDLAASHARANHYHEAEEIYIRIYSACWNSCVINDERLTNACNILLKFYEEHHHWQKLIVTYQEMLVQYRRHLGASHALTIKTLYILASLCSEHGYGHSTEYYEEIVTVLNGKDKVCHVDAKEAMVILCRDYYESGQWEKLKITCEILWFSWTHHQKELKFEASFIELLYMRYVYVLEHHFRSEYDTVRLLTTTYRDTSIAVYGDSASITIKALTELARICMRSEKYVQEAISCYEQIIKTSTIKSTTTTTTVSTTISSTIKQKLTRAYISYCSKGSMSTETAARAVQIISEGFDFMKTTLGCSHHESLSVLRELVLLHIKTKNVKVVQSLLQRNTVEILTKEKHSKVLYEAAKSMGEMYVTCGLVEYGQSIVREIRRQIITKSYTNAEKFGFKIDSTVGKSSYVFLVTLQQYLGGKATLSYSEIMAELLTETVLYELYTSSLKSGTTIEITMTNSARYWAYLRKHSRTEELKLVEDHVFAIFMNHQGKAIKTSREATLLFFQGMLEELSIESRTTSIRNAACAAGSHKVRSLLEQQKFQQAYEVALCAFQFIKQERGYHHLMNIGHGFKLSAYMAGRGFDNPNFTKGIEPALSAEMVKLSQAIIRDVLDACKESNINFVRLKLGELNDLVGLLGAQGNFADLEWLLESLWSSREVQKSWSAETIIAIGRRYVQARLLGNHAAAAIRLCEDICYNLRRVWGPLDPKVLEMSEALSQVYTSAGRYAEAMSVHEEILRLVIEGDDGDDRTIDTMTPEKARLYLDLLKRSWQRLGTWDKSPKVYKDLVDQLLAMPKYKNHPAFKRVTSIDKWNVKEELSAEAKALGSFTPPREWEFVRRDMLTAGGDLIEAGRIGQGSVASRMLSPRPGMPSGNQRASSNWGLQLMMKHLHMGGGEVGA